MNSRTKGDRAQRHRAVWCCDSNVSNKRNNRNIRELCIMYFWTNAVACSGFFVLLIISQLFTFFVLFILPYTFMLSVDIVLVLSGTCTGINRIDAWIHNQNMHTYRHTHALTNTHKHHADETMNGWKFYLWNWNINMSYLHMDTFMQPFV